MSLSTSQQLGIAQKQKLSPQMFAAMEILQMSATQLEQRIEQELETNPALEQDSIGAEPESFVQNSFQNSFIARNNNQDGRDPKMEALANTPARGASLYDQLMDQWALVEVAPKIEQAGKILIGFVDDDGYIREPVEQILQSIDLENNEDNLEIDKKDLEQALGALQQNLEPVGLAAQDVRQCLLLQIDARMDEDPKADFSVERLLVCDYLKEVETHNLTAISKASGLSLQQVQTAIGNLKQFYFHPGRLLSNQQVQTITADVIIEYDAGLSRYVVSLAPAPGESLHLSEYYQQLSKDKSADSQAKEFIKSKINSAQWLINAISQRRNTLLQVARLAVDAQQEFLDKGARALKPLSMESVGQTLGIHTATVSRAVNEKYAQTARGTIALRAFFSGGMETDTGEPISWTAIEERIKQIVEKENKNAPLNDEQISKKLKEQGITLHRRTIAKYRNQLNIPSSRQRRVDL